MKSIIALAAVLALTSNVDAATKTTRSAKASKGTRVAAVKKPKVSDVSAAESEVQLTETAKLSEVKPIVQAKKWSAGLDVESYAPMASVKNDELGSDGLNDGETDYAAKLGYKVADKVTVQAVAEWMQLWGAGDSKSDTTLLDPSLRISKSDLADLGNGVGLSGAARLYLPVSEASQDKEQIAQIRLYGIASREITKSLSAGFMLSPRFFAQQNDTYINAKGETRNVDSFRLLSSASLKYSLSEKVALEQTVGVYQKWKTNTDRADNLDASTSVYYTPASWVELNFGIRQTDDATDLRNKSLSSLYNSRESEYFLVGSFSI